MDLPAVSSWVAIIALLVSIINTVWVWLSRPGQVTKKLYEELRDDVRGNLKEHDRRLQTVEDEIRHLPTKDDLHEIGQQLARMEAEMAGMTRSVRRIDDYLRTEQK